jgi:hypothetical protein
MLLTGFIRRTFSGDYIKTDPQQAALKYSIFNLQFSIHYYQPSRILGSSDAYVRSTIKFTSTTAAAINITISLTTGKSR